ncbi:MAG: macrolide family glycosyltransferase [Acidobacteriota bacterium]
MAKGLILGLPLQGHMTPLLALVRDLVSRGDDLVVYSTPPFAADIEQTGAQFRRYRPGRLDDLTQLPDRTEAISMLLMGIVGEVLDADLPEMRAARPDYIVTDSVAPWGHWVAQVLGVPIATSVTTFAVNRHVLAFAAAHGVRPKSVGLLVSKLKHVSNALILRRRLSRLHQVRGLGVFRTVFGRSDLNIVYTSRAFQPRSETFDRSFHFVGPPAGARTEPAAGFSWPGGMQPMVYVSLGTLFNADVTFYRHCVAAFRDEPVQVIMSIGSRVSPSDLGAAPANVVVASYVPQLEVLRRASAFVTHGGMNSVSESLMMGVPMVAVPQMGEQDLVSRRVEQLSAGLYLAKAEVSPDRLRLSVRRLLTEERFRQAAAGLGETLLAAGGTAEAATRVQAFAMAATREP